MRRLTDLWSKEPALIVAFASALVAALAMPEAWARVVMAAVALVGGVVTRSQVSPVGSGPPPPPAESPSS